MCVVIVRSSKNQDLNRYASEPLLSDHAAITIASCHFQLLRLVSSYFCPASFECPHCYLPNPLATDCDYDHDHSALELTIKNRNPGIPQHGI